MVFKRLSQLWILALVAGAVASPPAAAETTLTVNVLDDAGDGVCDATCTLRDAVDTAVAGDRIAFGLPLPATIELTATLSIGKHITISGPGADQLHITTNHLDTVISITSPSVSSLSVVVITGVTIRNGGRDPQSPAGGIRIRHGDVTIEEATVRDNISGGAGGISNSHFSRLRLERVTISGNRAGPLSNSKVFGGGIFNAGDLTVVNGTISGNRAGRGGGISTFSEPG